LADKSGKKALSLKSAVEFLEILIADNSIGYPQDKKHREWTFNYYANNARFTLMDLAVAEPALMPRWQKKQRKPKERWEHAQDLLERAITKFETHLVLIKKNEP